MLTPKQIIEDIRLRQYGIGLSADPASHDVIANMRGQLDGALKLLSQELYAKDVHFVLELIQNAEDNTYPSDVVPEVRFTLTEDAILVQNNENGFSEANVRALCSVAKSKKTKVDGYIGEKGIGFKSVFRVTDEPYISSNGFTFSLPLHDAESGLGYVIPVWHDELPEGIDPGLTNIRLPLNQKGLQEPPQIADIHPSLLLFLKKLRRIEIRNGCGSSTKWITREGEGNRIFIRTDASTDRWVVVRRSLEVPAGIVEEKRKEVKTVEVVLAFPMTEDGTADASAERSVFAFLPIRQYGFRFAIQADFILTSSREDVREELTWNQWLRDCIAPLFANAVSIFKKDAGLRTNFLAYVPSAKYVTDDFFKSVPDAIIETLKESECILEALTKPLDWHETSWRFLAGTRRVLP